MSSEPVPTPLGMSSSDDSRTELSVPEMTNPQVSNPTPTGTASVDDLVLSLSHLSPDPLLEEFKPEAHEAEGSVPGSEVDYPTGPVGQPTSQASSWTALDLEEPRGPAASSVAHPESGVSAVVSALNLEPAKPDVPPKAPVAATPASAQFTGVDLTAPSPSKTVSSSTRRKDKDRSRALDPDAAEEGDDLPPRGMSLPMALLLSYTSAVTIGLIWVLWGHRVPREPVEADPFPAADTVSDPGHRAGQSHKLTPLPPLPAGRVARLGQTLRIGSLEVTPLEIKAGPVMLRREINAAETRKGGDNALSLRLRMKNVSTDALIVPLDEAFLRERGRGIRDSFLETGPIQQVEMFPLAVVSEWSIVGQEFRGLRPGESYESLVVTAPDAVARVAPETTWRIRLRTDVNQNETIGVRFGEKEIAPEEAGGKKGP
jgi:hypothetical protein